MRAPVALLFVLAIVASAQALEAQQQCERGECVYTTLELTLYGDVASARLTSSNIQASQFGVPSAQDLQKPVPGAPDIQNAVMIQPVAGAPIDFIFEGQPILGCADVPTNAEGVAECDLKAALESVPESERKCEYVKAVFDEWNGLRKAESVKLFYCPEGKSAFFLTPIFNEQADWACLPLFALMGLLVSWMYVAGKSPLSYFDITTPKLPKPKKMAFKKIKTPEGWKQATRTMQTSNWAYKRGYKNMMGAFAKKLKESTTEVGLRDRIDEIARDRSLSNTQQVRELNGIFEDMKKRKRTGDATLGRLDGLTIQMLDKWYLGLTRYTTVQAVHEEALKKVMGATGMGLFGGAQAGTVVGGRLMQVPFVRFAGEAVGNVAKVTSVSAKATKNILANSVLGLARVTRAEAILPEATKDFLKKQAGDFAFIPGQRIKDVDADMRTLVERMVQEINADILLIRNKEIYKEIAARNDLALEKRRIESIAPSLSLDERCKAMERLGDDLTRTMAPGAANAKLYAAEIYGRGRLIDLENIEKGIKKAEAARDEKAQADARTELLALSEDVRKKIEEVLAAEKRALEVEGVRAMKAELDWELDRQAMLTDIHEARYGKLVDAAAKAAGIGAYEAKARAEIIAGMGGDYKEAFGPYDPEKGFSGGGIEERAGGFWGEPRKESEQRKLLEGLAREAGLQIGAKASIEELKDKILDVGGGKYASELQAIEWEWKKDYADEVRMGLLKDYAHQQGIERLTELEKKLRMEDSISYAVDNLMDKHNAQYEDAIRSLAQDAERDNPAFNPADPQWAGTDGLRRLVKEVSEAEKNRKWNILLKAAKKANIVTYDRELLAARNKELRRDVRGLTGEERAKAIDKFIDKYKDTDKLDDCLTMVGAREKAALQKSATGERVTQKNFWEIAGILEKSGYGETDANRNLAISVPDEKEPTGAIEVKLFNAAKKLDETGVARPGGAVRYDMTKEGPWIGQPNGEWYPLLAPTEEQLKNGEIPKKIRDHLQNINLSKGDVPFNVQLWYKHGDIAEKFDPDKHLKKEYLQDGKGNMLVDVTGRAIGTGDLIKAGVLFAVERKPAKFKDFTSKPGLQSFAAMLEGALIHPVVMGLEKSLVAAGETSFGELYSAKVFVEQSSQVVREFKQGYDAGEFVPWMAELQKGSTDELAKLRKILLLVEDEKSGTWKDDLDNFKLGVGPYTRANVEPRIASLEKGIGLMKRYDMVWKERYDSANGLKDLKKTIIPELKREVRELEKRLEKIPNITANAGTRTRLNDELNGRRKEIGKKELDARVLELQVNASGVFDSELRVLREEVKLKRAELEKSPEQAMFIREFTDSLSFMAHVEELRNPLVYKTPRAHSASYGSSLFIPAGYTWGPMTYLNPIEHLGGKNSFGMFWGAMLAPEFRFGQRFFRATRPFILARQGVPFPTDPAEGYKPHSWKKAMAYLVKGERLTRPREAIKPRWKDRKSLDEIRDYFWKLTPAGRYPMEERWHGWHGFTPWLAWNFHNSRGVAEEGTTFSFLKEKLQQITPEQARDLGLRAPGPFSPVNRNAWFTTFKAPEPVRMGAVMANYMVKNYPHLATPKTREAADLHVLQHSMKLPDQLKMLEQDFEFLKPWKQLSFGFAIPPIAALEIGRWLKQRAMYGMSMEDRQRYEESGLWRSYAGFKQKIGMTGETMAPYLGISAARWTAILAAGATAGPLGAFGVYGGFSVVNAYYPAYPPNVISQWWMKTRATSMHDHKLTAYGGDRVKCDACNADISALAHVCNTCGKRLAVSHMEELKKRARGGRI